MKKSSKVIYKSSGMKITQQGFNLIELMITVVIIALLSMIAVPAYNDNVRKSKRSDAMSTLTTVASRQEQYFLDNKTYTADLTNLGYGSAGDVNSLDTYYKINVTVASTTAFTITATPVTADPECNVFTLNDQGTRGVSGGTYSATDCW